MTELWEQQTTWAQALSVPALNTNISELAVSMPEEKV